MPAEVRLHDFGNVRTPDDAVRGRDDARVEGEQLLGGVGDGFGVGEDDVGVVGLRLLHDLGEVGFVVETGGRGVVLTEDVH